MKKYIVSAMALLLTAFSAEAQLKNANNAEIAKVKAANEKVNTLQCRFKQTKVLSFMNTPTVTEGDFYFTKPNKLSMKYDNGEVMIINDDNVIIGKKGKVRNVKAKNKQVEALANTLLSCMNGDITALDGTLESGKNNGKAITFKVKVDFTVGKSKVSNLELSYDSADKTLKTITMIEPDGSKTVYDLIGKSLNKSIDEAVYNHAKN